MVPFAGYEMPVEYKEMSGGVLKEHLHVREHAGLFDVSHMGQLQVSGKHRIEFLNFLTVADMSSLEPNNAVYSLLLNESGGVKDDTIITKYVDYVSVVINAGCKEKDLAHLYKYQQQFKQEGKEVEIEHLEDQGLLAIQGPKAAQVLQEVVKNLNLNNLKFMRGCHTSVSALNDTPIIVTRCGYTGEDGFEVSVEPTQAVKLADLLISKSNGLLKPIGLGARDSLRLEAGLCLYGHDLEEDISPIEASLIWAIAKNKRSGGFLGSERIVKDIQDGVQRKRIGFVVKSGPSAREGVEVLDQGNLVGKITSGTYSPLLKCPIGMAYVHKQVSKPGKVLQAKIRDKVVDLEVTKMPFVPNRYFKK